MVGVTSRLIYTFTVPGPIGAGYVLAVSSTNFGLGTCSMITSVGATSTDCNSVTFSTSQNKLATITLILNNAVNNNIAVPGTLGFTIKDALGRAAYTSDTQTFNFTLQTIASLAVDAVTPTLGVDSALKIQFTPTMSLPANTKILVRLPGTLPLKGALSCNIDGTAQTCSALDASTVQASLPAAKGSGVPTTLILNTVSLPICGTTVSAISVEAQQIEQSQVNLGTLTPTTLGSTFTQTSIAVLNSDTLKFILTTAAVIRTGSLLNLDLPAELYGQESATCSLVGANAGATCGSPGAGRILISGMAPSADIPANTVLTLNLGPLTNPRVVASYNIQISVVSAAPTSCKYGASTYSLAVSTPASFPTLSLQPNPATLSTFHALSMAYTVPNSIGSSDAVAQVLSTDKFEVVLPTGIVASSAQGALSLPATSSSLVFNYLMSPATGGAVTFTVQQKDSQGRVVRQGTSAVAYSGAAFVEASMVWQQPALRGKQGSANLTLTSPSYLDKGQLVKLTLSRSAFGLVSVSSATVGSLPVTVSTSGDSVFLALPSSVSPGAEISLSLSLTNPTVDNLAQDQLQFAILTPDNRTSVAGSPLKSRYFFSCEASCAQCIFFSDNCTACITGYALQGSSCILLSNSAFPSWFYPVFFAAATGLVVLLVLFKNPFNAVHALWTVISLIQVCYCLLAWGLLLAGVFSGTPKYSAAVFVLLGWGLLGTLGAGFWASKKIKKFADWREAASRIFGIAVSRIGVVSRRKKGKGLGWRLDPSEPHAEFDSWKKLVDLVGLGTFLAINLPVAICGILIWATVYGYPFAVEAAIFQSLHGLSLAISWWELRKVEIKPEHQSLARGIKDIHSTKINGFGDDSVSSLHPIVKDLHLDVPDSLIESSKETNRVRGHEEEGPMSKTASRKGPGKNDKDSLIYIEDGQEVPSNQLRSFVFDPENPGTNATGKARYKEVNKKPLDFTDADGSKLDGSLSHNQIQLIRDPKFSQDSDEAHDRVGPLPPHKDYKIPYSSRQDTGREESLRTSRKDPYLLDHSPGSELNRKALESELNGQATPSVYGSSIRPYSDKFPGSASNRARYSAGNETGNSLSSDRVLRALATHIQNLPSATEREERNLPLVADTKKPFPTFPNLNLDKVLEQKSLAEVPHKDSSTKVVPLSEVGESVLSKDSREYILRPGKPPVSGRRKIDPTSLPRNAHQTEVMVDKANQRRLIEPAPLVSVPSKQSTTCNPLTIKLANPSRFKENRLRERLGAHQRRYLEIIYEKDEGDAPEVLKENPVYDDPLLDKQIQIMEMAKIGSPPDSTVVELSRGRKSVSELINQRPDLRLDLAKIKAIDRGTISFDEKTGTAILEHSGERADHERIHKIIGTDPRLIVRPEDTPESLRTRQRLLDTGIRLEAVNSIEPAELERVAERATQLIDSTKPKSKFGSPKHNQAETNRSGKSGKGPQNHLMKINPLSARQGQYIDDPENNLGLEDADGEDSDVGELGPYGPAPPTQDLLRSSQELLRKDLAQQLKNGKASAKDIAEKAHEYGLGGKLAQLRVAINPEDIVETSERLELKAINGQPLEAFVRRQLKFKDPATLPLKDQLPELMARGIYLDSEGRMLPVGDQPMEDVSRGLLRDPKGKMKPIASLKAEELAKGIWMNPETQKIDFVNGQPANTLGSLLLLDRNGQKTNLRKQNKSDISKGILATEKGEKVDLGVPQMRHNLEKGEFKWKDGLLYRWVDQTPQELSKGIVRGMGRLDQPFGGYDITRPIEEVQSVWPAPDPKNKTNQNSLASMASNSSAGVGGLSTNEIKAKKKEFYDNDPYESKKKSSEPLVFPEDTDSYLIPTSQPYTQSASPNRGISSRHPLNASKSTVYNSLQSSGRGVDNAAPPVDTLLINLVADNNESFDLSVRIEETADDGPEEFVGIEMSKPNISTGVGGKNGPFHSSTASSRLDSKSVNPPVVGMKYGRLPDLDMQPKPRGISGFDSSSVGNLRPEKEQDLVGRSSLGDLKSGNADLKPTKTNKSKLSPLIEIDTGSPRVLPGSFGQQIKAKNGVGQGTSMPGTSTAGKRPANLITEAMQTMPNPANSAKQLGPIKKPYKGLQAGSIKQTYDSSPKYTPVAPLQPPIVNKLQTTGQSDFLKKNYVDKLEREVERIKSRGHQLHKYNVGKGSLDRLDRTGGYSTQTNNKGSRDA